MSCISLTDNTFQDLVLNSDLPCIVDFWANWCQPCLKMAPILDGLADKLNQDVKFYKVDVEIYPNLAKRYQIRSIPALLFFNQATCVGQKIGLSQESQIEAWIKEMLEHIQAN